MNVEPIHVQSNLTPVDGDAVIAGELLRIVSRTVVDIDGADHAAIVGLPARRLLATTSELAQRLELIQRSAGIGPSVDAEQSGKIERINYLSDGVWPEFEMFCRDCDVRSVAAFPILDGPRTIGVLTVYSSDHHAFGAPELRIGRAAAEELITVVRAISAVSPEVSREVSTPLVGRRTLTAHG